MKIVVVFIGMIVFQDWMISIFPVYINGEPASLISCQRAVSQQLKTHGLGPCLFYGYPFERTAGARVCSADADKQITGIISFLSTTSAVDVVVSCRVSSKVEPVFCKHQVVGSSPTLGYTFPAERSKITKKSWNGIQIGGGFMWSPSSVSAIPSGS